MSGPVTGDDGLLRCPWAASDPLLRDYHDSEWGVPIRDERGLYERIMLEAFQSGLSWRTVLAKRPAFRAAFADFDPDIVGMFGEADIERLMCDAGIIRNRRKIEAAIINAGATLQLREGEGLPNLIWRHRPDKTPAPAIVADVPTVSLESRALAKALKAEGFAFVGPTTAHALMEAIGMVDTHLVDCFRRGCRDGIIN